jgi:hypothetical protein
MIVCMSPVGLMQAQACLRFQLATQSAFEPRARNSLSATFSPAENQRGLECAKE